MKRNQPGRHSANWYFLASSLLFIVTLFSFSVIPGWYTYMWGSSAWTMYLMKLTLLAFASTFFFFIALMRNRRFRWNTEMCLNVGLVIPQLYFLWLMFLHIGQFD